MAWQSFLVQPLVPQGDAGCHVSVAYYDDADPANAGAGLQGPGQGTASAGTDLITITSHGLVAGNQVIFTALTGGAGLQLDSPYYVLATGLTANAFGVSRSPGGTVVDITSNATALTAFKLTPPTNSLTQVFQLSLGKTITDLLPQIDFVGQQIRASAQQAASINATVPIGTIRAVPA